jgi:hypothetical protein
MGLVICLGRQRKDPLERRKVSRLTGIRCKVEWEKMRQLIKSERRLKEVA